MKSDIDIEDDVFQHLKQDTAFWTAMQPYGFTPAKLKMFRSAGCDQEEIIVSVLANGDVKEVQEAFVNVNVYLKDIEGTESTAQAGTVSVQYKDRSRLRQICQICATHLTDVYGASFRFSLSTQKVGDDKENKMHYVNNKLLYKQLNS